MTDPRDHRLIRLALLGLLIGLALPGFAQPATAPEDTDEDTGAPAADLPAATEIFDRYIEATGGEEAHRAITSMTVQGTVSIPAAGITGTITSRKQAPDLSLTTVEISGMGTTQEGFDGSVAWTADPMRGTQIKEGKELNQARHDADLHADLNYADYYKTFETVELTEFRDQPAYKVRLVNNDDVESFQFYSPETGLKLGEQQTVPTQMGPIHVTGIINAYADHGDIKVPADVTNDMGHMQQRITIESVSFEPIEESVFALPPAVQALLAPPAEVEEEEPETPAEDEPETPAEDEPGTPADPEPDGE